MSKAFLLIVEGEKTEKQIFEDVLCRYGFNVVRREKIKLSEDVGSNLQLDKVKLYDDKDTVIIVQGTHNRIRDIMKNYHSNTDDYERIFGEFQQLFAGIFFIYDVDHTSKDTLQDMFCKYGSETSGMLLVSSPCIEVIYEPNRTSELKVAHLTEYKHMLNKDSQSLHNKSALNYILENFDELMLKFIDKNYNESGLTNVIEHPQYVIDKINACNDRTEEEVIYRYFTTVIYVCIAYMKGLVKQIDNIDIVKQFFQEHIRK